MNALGAIFGLMPHPEAYLYPENHPRWIAQREAGTLPADGLGLHLLAGGVRAALQQGASQRVEAASVAAQNSFEPNQ